MGTYNLPRNVKGEGRLLYVFSTKALMYTFVGAGIGFLFYLILNMLSFTLVGYIMVLVFGLLGFIIGTFKMPETNAFEITKKTGGEQIDDVIKRGIKFKMNRNKVYVYSLEKKDKNVKKQTEESRGEE